MNVRSYLTWILISGVSLQLSACSAPRSSLPNPQVAAGTPEPVPSAPSTPGRVSAAAVMVSGSLSIEPSEKLITILATNDIHGGIEPKTAPDRSQSGGLTLLGGTVKAIREGLKDQLADRSGILLLDGGDQFQGTLISNYNEGKLMFDAMSALNYDAVVPGNHDYDFGPVGWLYDRVIPGLTDQNPRGALEKLVQTHPSFGLVSANTYFRASLKDRVSGQVLGVESKGCVPTDPNGLIAWENAKRPEFLQPYLIRNVAGVRVALIGIDYLDTAMVTTMQNVSDLCFRDEVDSYLEVRRELEGRADLFIMLIHNGAGVGKDLVRAITAHGPNLLHAIVAGHTHQIEKAVEGGVPIIQDGADGVNFGRIDLVWNQDTQTLVNSKMRVISGLQLKAGQCVPAAHDFCVATPGATGSVSVALEGREVVPTAEIQTLIDAARQEVAPVAGEVLGQAQGDIKKDRTLESPLADQLTDALRLASGADVSFMNTGGIRQNLLAGNITYEDLFRVLPFGNKAVVLGPLPVSILLKLLQRSIETCGKYGALMQSGLKVSFEVNCANAIDQVDAHARLLHVETVGGEVLLDLATGVQPDASRAFTVVTLDFLSSGGDGFSSFAGVPQLRDLGIVRDVLRDQYRVHPAQLVPRTDGRWRSVAVPAQPTPVATPSGLPNPG